MELGNIAIYADSLFESIKNSLEYEVREGFDKRLETVKRLYDIDFSLNKGDFQSRLANAKIEKELLEKLLDNELLLNVYLEFEVRKFIISLLKFIADGPNCSMRPDTAIKAFERMGFVDASDYLEKFDTVEDVRKDLFEQVGFEYFSYDELTTNLMDARINFDLDALEIVKANFEKAGIDEVTGNYSYFDYYTLDVAVMPEEKARLLVETGQGMNK